MAHDMKNLPQGRGWAVFHCSGSIHGEYQIQRFDEEALFANDTDAWDHVWTQALMGDRICLTALRFIREHNAAEFAMISNRARMQGLGQLNLETTLPARTGRRLLKLT